MAQLAPVMRKLSMLYKWRIFLVVLLAGSLVLPAMAGGHQALIKAYGRTSPTSFGGYTVSAAGLNQYYVVGIEVPPGAAQLVIDIFDADLGAGGNADISGDRDNQNNGAWDSFYIYTLYDPQLNFIPVANYNYFYGDAVSPPGADNAWTTFYSAPNPQPGHWLVVVYPYPPTAAGGAGASDDLNAFGVRAHDGDPGPGGVEFNTYMIAPIPIGTNGIPGPTQSSARHTVYPYVTSGCELNTHDFDSDVPNLPAGTPPLETQIQLTNRTGAYTHTVTQATMSGQDEWVNNTVGPDAGGEPSGTDFLRDGMGIWSGLLVANEQGTGGATAGANYNEVIIANFNNPTPVPSNAIEADTFRWYLPTDANSAPVKTYLTQRVNFWSGPNPPVVGQTTEVEIEIEVFNPTAFPVTFSAADNDVVRSQIPAVPELAFVGGSVTVSQGTAPGTGGLAIPPAGGSGTLEWDPGIIPAASSALLTYRIAVTPSIGGQRIAVTGTPATGGTTADFVDHTGNRNSSFANYTFGPLCELAVTESQPVPTPVYLSYVLLSAQPEHYRLQWSTAFEAGNLAFRIYDSKQDSPEHLLAEVPVKTTGTIAGADYEVDLPKGDWREVWIMDVALDGAQTWHGPFRLGQPFGSPPVQRLSRTEAQPESTREGRSDSPAIPSSVLRQRADWQKQQAVPELDLITDQGGVYRVSFDELKALGYDYTGMNSARLRLSADGQAVPVAYNPQHNGVIRPGDYFEFIASQHKTLYSSQKAYRLSSGNAILGEGMDSLSPGHLPSATGEFASWQHTAFEQDSAYSFSSPDTQADPWYWRSYLVRSQAVTDSLNFTLQNVDTSQPSALQLSLWTMTDWPGVIRDHHLQVAINGVPILDAQAEGMGQQNLMGQVPAGVLRAGENTLELRFPADTGVAYELNYLDAFAIGGVSAIDSQQVLASGQVNFPRKRDNDAQPLADDILYRHSFDSGVNQLCQLGPCRSLRLAGQADLVAYQQSEQRLWRVTPASNAGIGTPEQVFTLRPQSLAETWLVAANAFHRPVVRPAAIGRIDLNAGTDLLVIAAPQFVDALQPWVLRRQQLGYTVSVVSVDDIYHHFSNGIVDANALRDFIAEAAGTHPIENILLVGADSYDYQNKLGLGQTAVLPGLYAATSQYVRYAPVDASFGDIDADGVPEVAVGRWPVRTLNELQTVVEKTLAFEQKAASQAAISSVMLTDANDGDTDFSELANRQQPVLPMPWNQQRIDGNRPEALADFRHSLSQNPLLVEYLGHSSATQWSAQGFLSSGEVQALENDGLSMWFQWGCWNNYAVSPLFVSLSEALLNAANGAVLTVGATAITDAKIELALRAQFLSGMSQGQSVGQALVRAKAKLLNGSGKNAQHLQDVLAGITILGDPSLRVVY